MFRLVPSMGVSVPALVWVIAGFSFSSLVLAQRSAEAVDLRRLEQTHTDKEKSESEVSKQQPLAVKREPIEPEREAQIAFARYKLCLGMAQKAFEVTWASYCKTISEQDRKRHERCLTQVDTKAVCAPLARKPSDTCALPVELASKLNKELEESKGRCRPEAVPASSE